MTKQDEILKTIHLGDLVYLIDEEGRVYSRKIELIQAHCIRVNFSEYDKNAYIEFDKDYCNLSYSYNRSRKYFYCFSKKDAAILKKEIVKKHLSNLVNKCESSYKELVEFRKKNYDILNSKDIDKWIEEFKRNSDW